MWAKKISAITAVVAIATIALSLVFDTPQSSVGLIIGAGVLMVSLGVLQLQWFREGDLNKKPPNGLTQAIPRAPAQLRNPHFRAVWSNLEMTRQLMAQKEREHTREKRAAEKKALGLTEEETILFMETRSWISSWPLIAFSLVLLTACALAPDDLYSFLALLAGLAGLLTATVRKGSDMYYLTNFRVLVRRQGLLSRASNWFAVHYGEIQNWSIHKGATGKTLTIDADRLSVDMKGLTRRCLAEAQEILQQNSKSILKSETASFDTGTSRR